MSKSLRMAICSIFALSMLTTAALAETSSHDNHASNGHAIRSEDIGNRLFLRHKQHTYP